MKYQHPNTFPVVLISACILAPLFTQAFNAQTDQRSLEVKRQDSKESRVALVIGNSAYRDAPLRNPVNDARDTAQALRDLGFEVIYEENLSQNDMKRSIRAFGDKIRNGGVGLFYYSGHGAQVRGINYLVPVGATITNEPEIEYEAVDAGLVLAQMESARNRLNIVILDACRNNPFARSFRSPRSGLASIDAPAGTLIAYATAPGSVASDGDKRNGLYTQELLKAMRVPGLKIEDVFKQVRIAVQSKSANKQLPWESSSLVGDFYFSEHKTGPGKTGQRPEISESDYLEVEKIYGAHKAEKDCDVIRRLVERLKPYYSNTNLVPEDKRYSLLYPTKNLKPTIANLARDRYLRIKEAKSGCFRN